MNSTRITNTRSPNRNSALQRGVAAVEFALVFPVFFLLVYGMITYGIIFIAQQSMTLAVQEGGRAALRYSTDPGLAACDAVNVQTSWLGANLLNCGTSKPVPIPCPYPAPSQCMRVTVTYPYKTKPLVPIIPLFGLLVPDQLQASAIVQLEPTFSNTLVTP
jgi:hypothetical protein